jgi:transcription termination factor NusB
MDYLPVNMNFQDGEVQGDYTMIGVGPYDTWAIEYGYAQDEAKLKDILSRVAEPELQYATDEDTFGPDPLARRYDFSKDPLDYARNQMRIAKRNRERIIGDLVKDGDSWARARRYYELTLGLQIRSVGMMANWLGGDFIHRDKKGDRNGRVPIEPVPAKQQRDALTFVVENAFQDQAYGLTPDLLTHMAEEKWWDDWSSIFADSTWPVHDQIMGFQAYTLTMLMNPDTLRRIYDNEFLATAQTDVVTLPELLETIKQRDARNPMISSLRRNLQREHLERLIDLSRSNAMSSAVYKPICTLVVEQLRQLKAKIDPVLDTQKDSLDPYSQAHLRDASVQIQKALDAHYVYQSL